MGRAPCCEKIGLKKGRWTAEEDDILMKYIATNGEGSWRSLPKNAGLLRCGKSCRLRWVNYLRSDLKKGNISPEEEETIIKLHTSLGNRWSIIAGHLPGRTDNEIKNYWNSHLSKKLQFPGPTDSNNEPSELDIGRVSSKSTRKKNGKDDNMIKESEFWGKLGEVEVVEPLDGTEESVRSVSTNSSEESTGDRAVKEGLNGMKARWVDWETEGMEFRLWDGVMSDVWAPWTWDNIEAGGVVGDGGSYQLEETPDNWLSDVF